MRDKAAYRYHFLTLSISFAYGINKLKHLIAIVVELCLLKQLNQVEEAKSFADPLLASLTVKLSKHLCLKHKSEIIHLPISWPMRTFCPCLHSFLHHRWRHLLFQGTTFEEAAGLRNLHHRWSIWLKWWSAWPARRTGRAASSRRSDANAAIIATDVNAAARFGSSNGFFLSPNSLLKPAKHSS